MTPVSAVLSSPLENPLPPHAEHGGCFENELSLLGRSREEAIDFSVNINPFAPCAVVKEAIEAARWDRYPHPSAAPACAALAAAEGVSPRRVVLGNGAVDLLWTLSRAVLRPGDLVGVVEPAFSEMAVAARRARAGVIEHRTRPEEHFAVSWAALDGWLAATRPRLLYLCSPSNPVGITSPAEVLAELARRHEGTLFVVDVSFLSLSTRHDDRVPAASERIAWVRSLTKDHGIPGLRVGYAVVPEPIAAAMEAERPPWSVNALSQAAAIATTTDAARAFVESSRVRLLEHRDELARSLISLGLRVHPSDTIYALVDLGGRRFAADLRAALLRRDALVVRDCSSFGLPHHVRLAARPMPDRARLLAALEQELHR
jgi:histidinol-phosphate/aromatic aminotransferase/cobyric acid decarboxylase-like protein